MSEDMLFRRAVEADMPEIMRVVREARSFMCGLGIDQWQDGYPEPEVLLEDIRVGQLYVFAEGASVRAVAALVLDREPVYEGIDGAWLTGPEEEYLTIHRMATDDASRGRGLAARMLAEAEDIARENGCTSVRVDTHPGNAAMRRFLEKHGCVYCGTVYYYVKKGLPDRVAYEKFS